MNKFLDCGSEPAMTIIFFKFVIKLDEEMALPSLFALLLISS